MLMRTVSGIRGIVGEGLTPDGIAQYVNAFLQVTKAKKIAVGRDSRTSGPAIEKLIASVCELSGVDVVSLGLATTPTVEMAVEKLGCGGGIIITASHNPAPWNAMKFLEASGTFLVAEQIEELLDIADNGRFVWSSWDKLGKTEEWDGGDDLHVKETLALPFIDVELIRSKKFRVAVDLVNGAGCNIFPQLFKELGCETTVLFDKPDGLFPRGAEPTPENLVELSKAVKENNCVVGFASDPDSDRCALVAESGRAVGEEYTLAIAVDLILSKKSKGDIAVNLSTSRLNEDIAKKYGRKTHRSKVGEINVSQVIKAENCAIGGEGNGGVILPDLHLGRDGILAAALVLQWLAETGKTIEEFVAELPPYVIAKDKFSVEGIDTNAIFAALKEKYSRAEVNELDGLRLEMPEAWIHVRKSNTEPIIRVMVESAENGLAEKLKGEVGVLVDSLK